MIFFLLKDDGSLSLQNSFWRTEPIRRLFILFQELTMPPIRKRMLRDMLVDVRFARQPRALL
jgi:hypothetical protein